MRLPGEHPALFDLSDLAQLIKKCGGGNNGNLFIVSAVDDEEWHRDWRSERSGIVVFE